MSPLFLHLFTTAAFVTTTLLNFTLSCLLLRKSTRIGKYRRFLICSLCFDEAYSLCEWITSPFYYTDHGFSVIVAISFIAKIHPWIEVFFFIWMSLFLDIVILVTQSFVYRYAIVTRSRLLQFYENIIYAFPIASCSMLFGFLITGMVYATFYPVNAQFRKEILGRLSKEGKFRDRLMIGFDTEKSGTFIAGATTIISVVVIFSICCCTIISLGVRINMKTRSATISEKSRANQRRMLRMLLLQTLNPVITVYIPCAYRVFTLIVKSSNREEIHWILSSFYALFPVFNPLIVISCVQDYRMCILRILGWAEATSVTSVVVRSIAAQSQFSK